MGDESIGRGLVLRMIPTKILTVSDDGWKSGNWERLTG